MSLVPSPLTLCGIRMQKRTLILLGAALSLGAQRLTALGAQATALPLAVTMAASPSLSATPTGAERILSQEHLERGLDCLKKKDALGAVQELLDSVRLDPGAVNFKALGTAYYQAGNVPKAVWAYRESLKRGPDDKVSALVRQLTGEQAPSLGAAAHPAQGNLGGAKR